MPKQFTERLSLLANSNSELLTGIQRGLEKESLRVDSKGTLAQTPHPASLGSALTNPHITTDFSEALMEFITPVLTDIEDSLQCLDNTHRFVYANLEDEQLWTASMPCVIGTDDTIPVAQYGSSNVAQMKTTYRKGLGNRYGRPMQTIAGIHYNFSLPDGLWAALQQQDHDKREQQTYITDNYFKLIRNFSRFSWLLVYCYGASPAVCKSFLTGRDHGLDEFDQGTLYLPYATALRMGDLGYQSSAQDNLNICYNKLDSYIETLSKAITNVHPDYASIGIKSDGDYQQLSSALLQIENEFYSPIRPKRVTDSGETPLGALKTRGVEYIEVRCIDVNPFLPLGIDADQIRFIDCFLLYCLFEVSPSCDEDDRNRIAHNLKAVVNRGREPGLTLATRDGCRTLEEWGNKLLDGIDAIAELLDDAYGSNDYQRVCREQREKLSNPKLTPSAMMLQQMRDQQKPFFRLSMDLADQHRDYFLQRPLEESIANYYRDHTETSLAKQHAIEAADTLDFDTYLAQYYEQYQTLK